MLALSFVLLAEVVRTPFPIVYEASEDGSYVLGGLAVVLVYAAPVLALLLSGRSRPSVLAAVALVAAARISVQLVHPIPEWLALIATAVALIGITHLVVATRDRLDGVILAAGLVAGLAVDTAIRATLWTWDLPWHASASALVATIALGGLALVAARWVGGLVDGGPGFARLDRLWALGPYLMLQLLFLQNPGYVGSQASIGFATAALVVLGGDALGALVVAWRPRDVGRAARVAGTVALAALASQVTAVHGWLVPSVVLVLQVGTTALVAQALDRPSSSRPTRIAVSLAIAGVAFAGLTLVWQIDIDVSLPFPREVIPAVAVAVVGAASLAAAPVVGRRRGDRDFSMFVPAVLAVVAIAVAGWLWLDGRSVRTIAPAGRVLRLVSFNVRGAVDPAGQVDDEAIAESILRFDPDVVLLQEVARGWPIHGGGDLIAYLQHRLRMPYVFQPAADDQFGNAVLSRVAFRSLGGALLPEVDDMQRRSYVAIVVNVPDGPLVVVDTHLEGGSAEQIHALLDAWGGAVPAVVAGDMNMTLSDEAEVSLFTDAGLTDVESATGHPCRTTSAEPTSTCDRPSWIFVSDDIEINSFRIGAPSASDHLPLYLALSIGP